MGITLVKTTKGYGDVRLDGVAVLAEYRGGEDEDCSRMVATRCDRNRYNLFIARGERNVQTFDFGSLMKN